MTEGIQNQIDLLLVYPPWTVLSSRGILANALPPQGILSIAAHAEREGYNVKVIDIHVERMDKQTFYSLIKKYNPRLVGISVLSQMVAVTHALAKEIKMISNNCKIMVGGVHAELFPETMLQNSSIDYVIRGDGEGPTLKLLQGQELCKIESLSYRNISNTKVIHNVNQKIVMDLDEYPIPAYHLVKMDKYFPSATSYKNLPATNVIMTRGCPGKCTFCNSANTVLRSHSPRRVFEMIKTLRSNYGIRQIQFYDDTFTVNKKGVYELCNLLIEDKTDITFTCYARGDCWSEDIAKILKKAGCHQVLVGIETGSEKIAKVIRKPIRKEKYKRLVDIAHKYNIEVRAGFIIGNMEETFETMDETLQFAIDLEVDFFQLNINTPYPGTQLFIDADREGRIKHKNFKLYGQSLPIVELDDLSADDILNFSKKAFRKFYMRPVQIFKQLKRIRKLEHIKNLISAFNLLIANAKINKEPEWADWNSANEEDFYDLEFHGNDVSQVKEFANLNYKVRESA